MTKSQDFVRKRRGVFYSVKVKVSTLRKVNGYCNSSRNREEVIHPDTRSKMESSSKTNVLFSLRKPSVTNINAGTIRFGNSVLIINL